MWEDAACAGAQPNWWDVDRWPPNSTAYRHAVAQAKQVCRRCPIRVQCAQHAIDHREPCGVWGGLTPSERSTERSGKRQGRRLQPIRHGTAGGYQQHRYRDEDPCVACAIAAADYRRNYRKKVRA